MTRRTSRRELCGVATIDYRLLKGYPSPAQLKKNLGAAFEKKEKIYERLKNKKVYLFTQGMQSIPLKNNLNGRKERLSLLLV